MRSRKNLHIGKHVKKVKNMEFSIPCATFARLARIGASSPINPDGSKPHYFSLYYEVKNGHAVVIGTNIKVAAVEYIGKDIGPDCAINICVDDALIAQCDIEKSFGSNINFVYNDMLKYLSVKTNLGYVYPGNALIQVQKENAFHKWRLWFPDKMPTANKGNMFVQLDRLQVLTSAAPSGSVVFPDFIDTDIPVVLRDQANPNWLGLFMPIGEKGAVSQPALPSWVKK